MDNSDSSDSLAPGGSVGSAAEQILDQFGAVAVPPLDYSVFRRWPFEDMQTNVAMVLALTAFAVASVWCCGFAVKLASRFIGGRYVSVRQGMAASWAAGVTFLLAFPVQQYLMPQIAPALTFLVAVVLALLVFAIVLRENPLRVTATAIGSCLIGGMLSAGLLALTLFSITKFVPHDHLQRLADHTRPFTDSVIEQYGPEAEEERQQLREQWTVDALRQAQQGFAAESSGPAPIRDRKLQDNPFAVQAD